MNADEHIYLQLNMKLMLHPPQLLHCLGLKAKGGKGWVSAGDSPGDSIWRTMKRLNGLRRGSRPLKKEFSTEVLKKKKEIYDFKKSVFKAYEEGCMWTACVCSGEAHLYLVREEAEDSSSLSRERTLHWIRAFAFSELPQDHDHGTSLSARA